MIEYAEPDTWPKRGRGGWMRNYRDQAIVSHPDGGKRSVACDSPSQWPFDNYDGVDPIYSQRGDWVHRLTEYIDSRIDLTAEFHQEGVDLGISMAVQEDIAAGYMNFLAAFGLVPVAVEIPIVNDTHKVAGTCDRVYQATKAISTDFGDIAPGDLIIADLKTGSSVVKAAYACQLPMYADGVPYDLDTDKRLTWADAIKRTGSEGTS